MSRDAELEGKVLQERTRGIQMLIPKAEITEGL